MAFAPRHNTHKRDFGQFESNSSDELVEDPTGPTVPPKLRRTLGGSEPSGGSPSRSVDEYVVLEPSSRHISEDMYADFVLQTLPTPTPGADEMPCPHTCGKPTSRCRTGTFPVKKDSWQRHVGSYSRQSHHRCHPMCPGYRYLEPVASTLFSSRAAVPSAPFELSRQHQKRR